MADERVLKTRIRLLCKSYTEWSDYKSFIPLKGEVCISTLPGTSGLDARDPAVLIKIGDGRKTHEALPYMSALAADVYDWAKKANLDWADISDSFKASLKSYIGTELPDTTYQIVPDGTSGYKWKLQKSSDKGTTWTDATGSIDVTSIVTELGKKVDREVTGTNGKGIIFNEADGGGAKFEHTDGTESFVGVNDGGENGLMAQIYADKSVDGHWVGSRINVYHNGIFYISKANQSSATAKNDPDYEIVVKKDIKGISGALHFIGATTILAGETFEQAIARLMTEKGHTPVAGDVVIINSPGASKEFIYDGEYWIELGDTSLYATKAALEEEITARETADAALETAIAAEETRAKTEEAKKVDIGEVLILNCNYNDPE